MSASRRATGAALTAFGLAGLLLGGCSGSSDGNKNTTPPPSIESQASKMQQAAPSSVLVSEMGSAVTDALATEGQVAGGVARRERSVLPLAAMLPSWSAERDDLRSLTYDFDTTFSVPVDLDHAPNGIDKYPHATGTFTLDGVVTAQSGTGTAGSVTIALTATATGTVSAVNPDTADRLSLASGTVIVWTASLAWTATDEEHWSLELDLDGGPNAFNATFDPAVGPDAAGEVKEEFHGDYFLARNGQSYTWNAEVSGHHTTQWTDTAGNVTTVAYTVVGPNQILVTINGHDYGPFTHHQLRNLYKVYLALRA
jgi:hypothetical protein